MNHLRSTILGATAIVFGATAVTVIAVSAIFVYGLRGAANRSFDLGPAPTEPVVPSQNTETNAG